MARRDIPYPGGRCSLKCELENLWRELRTKLKSINGVPGDGAGDVKLRAGPNVTITNDVINNEITISAEDAVGIAKINGVGPDSSGEFTIDVAPQSILSVTPITNGLGLAQDVSGLATKASVDGIISGETQVGYAAHQDTAVSATNAVNAADAVHQTTADSQTTAGSQTSAGEAAKLSTARDINIQDADGSNTGTAAAFDGTANATIKLPATIKADIVGNADTATSAGTAASASEAAKLSTARTIQTYLASAVAASFDGSANVTPGVSGVLPIENGGTGNASKDWVDLHTQQTVDGIKTLTNGTARGELNIHRPIKKSQITNNQDIGILQFYMQNESGNPATCSYVRDRRNPNWASWNFSCIFNPNNTTKNRVSLDFRVDDPASNVQSLKMSYIDDNGTTTSVTIQEIHGT